MARGAGLGQAFCDCEGKICLLPVNESDGVRLDIRYATADNLTGAPIYTRPVALLHPNAHAMLLAAVARAAVLGLQITVVIRNRTLLFGVMAAVGWESIQSEWWHFQVPGMGGLPSLRAAEVSGGPM
jgi:D-alanyl-D-alanine dipeptidase